MFKCTNNVCYQSSIIKNTVRLLDNICMKKLTAVFVILCICGIAAASEYIHPFWSIGTSAMFYGDPAIKEQNESLKRQDYKSLVLNGEYGARFQLDDKVDFVMSAYLTLDSLGKSSQSILRLDYGVTGGVRLRPGLGGISLGCEYCTGQRADIDDLNSGKADGSTTQWGNGYRFRFEYDFSAFFNGIAPVLGVSWKSVPRGNNCRDGNLAFYFRLVG